MNIVRPSTGFNIRCADTVSAMVKQAGETNPAFVRYWGDVLERLKFTAHREGTPEPRLGNGFRLLVVNGVPAEGRPRLVVGYLALGDTVSISLLRIA